MVAFCEEGLEFAVSGVVEGFAGKVVEVGEAGGVGGGLRSEKLAVSLGAVVLVPGGGGTYLV